MIRPGTVSSMGRISRLGRIGILAAFALLCSGCTAVVVKGSASMEGGSSVSAEASSAPSSQSGGPSDLTPVDPLAPVPDPGDPTIKWQDCTTQISSYIVGQKGADRGFEFGCGTMRVPTDYADPTGKTKQLVLIRVHLTSQTTKKGSMLVNPGGPGGSGTNLAIGLALDLPLAVLKNFDLIGFDPRGVGESSPVTCLSAAEKDKYNATTSDPQTQAQISEFSDDVKSFATSCASKYDGLEHINSVETARDMDQIRRAVGDEKLTYLGYSYGTTLGAVYATLFPDKVRALVLDGAVDPSITDLEATEAQLVGFEKAFDRFAADCVAKGCASGPDPRATVQSLLVSSAKAPIPSSVAAETRKASDGIVTTGVISALYDKGEWPVLDKAIAQAKAGDSAGLFKLADSYNQRFVSDGKVSYSNLQDSNLAVNCNDSTTTFSLPDSQKYATAWRKKYTLFGGNFGWGLYSCSQWNTRRHPLPTISAPDAAPILVVGTKNDPATPYSGAVSLTKALGGKTMLLSWEGDGHTAYPKTTCVSDAVNAYLIDLTVPAANTDCPA